MTVQRRACADCASGRTVVTVAFKKITKYDWKNSKVRKKRTGVRMLRATGRTDYNFVDSQTARNVS